MSHRQIVAFGLTSFLLLALHYVTCNKNADIMELKTASIPPISNNTIREILIKILKRHSRRKGRQKITIGGDVSLEDVGDVIEDIVDERRGALDTLSNLSNIVTAILQLRSAFKQELNETVSGFLARQAGQAASYFQSWSGGSVQTTTFVSHPLPEYNPVRTDSHADLHFIPATRPPGITSDPYPGKVRVREPEVALNLTPEEIDIKNYINANGLVKQTLQPTFAQASRPVDLQFVPATRPPGITSDPYPGKVRVREPEVASNLTPEEIDILNYIKANGGIKQILQPTFAPFIRPGAGTGYDPIPEVRPHTVVTERPNISRTSKPEIALQGTSLFQINISVQARPEIGNLTVPQLDDLLKTISQAVSNIRGQTGEQLVSTDRSTSEEFKLRHSPKTRHQPASNFLDSHHPRLSVYKPISERFSTSPPSAKVPEETIKKTHDPFFPGKPAYWMNMYYPNGVPTYIEVTTSTTTEASTTPKKRRRKTRSTTTTTTTTTVPTTTLEPEIEYYEDS